MAITQKILHTVCILVACFKYFIRTTVPCGHGRDQRSLWFCQEQTKLILCYFYLLYRLWPVLKLEELKAKTFSSQLSLPHSLYSNHAHFTAGTGKCKRSRAVAIVEDIYWTHSWPYPIRFIENCVVFFKKG